jgi:hypothetical protein
MSQRWNTRQRSYETKDESKYPPIGTVTFAEEDGTPIGLPVNVDSDGAYTLVGWRVVL